MVSGLKMLLHVFIAVLAVGPPQKMLTVTATWRLSDSIPVNLCCPMSGSRMKIARIFKLCVHMGCFHLEVLVEMNQRSRKWQCPICLKNYALENVIIDPYFTLITSKMRRGGGRDRN